MEPLDPAAIMAEHQPWLTGNEGQQWCGNDRCAEYSERWPCLPYRLAAENAALRQEKSALIVAGLGGDRPEGPTHGDFMLTVDRLGEANATIRRLAAENAALRSRAELLADAMHAVDVDRMEAVAENAALRERHEEALDRWVTATRQNAALREQIADAWDRGYIDRLGDTPRYKTRAEWGNPYLAALDGDQ